MKSTNKPIQAQAIVADFFEWRLSYALDSLVPDRQSNLQFSRYPACVQKYYAPGVFGMDAAQSTRCLPRSGKGTSILADLSPRMKLHEAEAAARSKALRFFPKKWLPWRRPHIPLCMLCRRSWPFPGFAEVQIIHAS